MTKKSIQKFARELVREAYMRLPYSDIETDYDGRVVQSVYLGSVLHIMPSGKIYAPWASSNVDPCPVCHGTGNSTCRHCQGVGSREALEDEMMREALDEQAERCGCYITTSDGCASDLFLERVVEYLSDEQDMEDSYGRSNVH